MKTLQKKCVEQIKSHLSKMSEIYKIEHTARKIDSRVAQLRSAMMTKPMTVQEIEEELAVIHGEMGYLSSCPVYDTIRQHHNQSEEWVDALTETLK